MKFDVFCEKARLRGDPGAYYRRQPARHLQPPRPGRSEDRRHRPVRARDGLDGRCRRGKAPMVSPGEEGFRTCG
ncbi:MAG: hypothetical protein WDN24_06730 [Sphingomonas sp.]